MLEQCCISYMSYNNGTYTIYANFEVYIMMRYCIKLRCLQYLFPVPNVGQGDQFSARDNCGTSSTIRYHRLNPFRPPRPVIQLQDLPRDVYCHAAKPWQVDRNGQRCWKGCYLLNKLIYILATDKTAHAVVHKRIPC